MDSDVIFSKLDSLLVCEEGTTTTSQSVAVPPVVYEHEHERFLVAWVLLTRLSQEDLDRAWETHGIELSRFATSLLSDTEITKDEDDYDDDDTLLHIYYIRLVAQVTARLSTAPSHPLKQSIYKAWKNAACCRKLGNTVLALNTDVCNAFVAWMEHELNDSDVVIAPNDIWKAYTIAHAITHEGSTRTKEQERSESSDNHRDKVSMITVLENILGQTSDTDENTPSGDDEDKDAYTIGNLQRLLIGLFELTRTRVPEELIRSILHWMAEGGDREKAFVPDVRVLFHGWLLKHVADCISDMTTQKQPLLVGDHKAMDSLQKIMLAHAVSPDQQALRPMAWQGMAQITTFHGWSWSKQTSKNAPVCTWCRLACGEWKIQLEEEPDLSLATPDKLSVLNGCGRLMASVVQYLAGFGERPDKPIPLDTDALLHLREPLDETLSTTSAYLLDVSTIRDTTDCSIVIHLWSRLFSEILDLSTSGGTEHIVRCFKRLLSESNDESLMQALVHLLTSIDISDKDVLDPELLDSIIGYKKRFWTTIATPNLLKQYHAQATIHWACVAVEILAETEPKTIYPLAEPMLKSIAFLVESFQAADASTERDQISSNLRLLVDCYTSSTEHCKDIIRAESEARVLSRAIGILESV